MILRGVSVIVAKKFLTILLTITTLLHIDLHRRFTAICLSISLLSLSLCLCVCGCVCVCVCLSLSLAPSLPISI